MAVARAATTPAPRPRTSAGGQGHVEEARARRPRRRPSQLGGARAAAQAGGDRLGDLARRAARRLGQGHRQRAGQVAHLRLGRRGERHGGRVDAESPRPRRSATAERIVVEKGGVRHGRGAYRALVRCSRWPGGRGCSRGAASDAPAGPARRARPSPSASYDGERLVRDRRARLRGPTAAVCARVVALLPRLRPSRTRPAPRSTAAPSGSRSSRDGRRRPGGRRGHPRERLPDRPLRPARQAAG